MSDDGGLTWHRQSYLASGGSDAAGEAGSASEVEGKGIALSRAFDDMAQARVATSFLRQMVSETQAHAVLLLVPKASIQYPKVWEGEDAAVRWPSSGCCDTQTQSSSAAAASAVEARTPVLQAQAATTTASTTAAKQEGGTAASCSPGEQVVVADGGGGCPPRSAAGGWFIQLETKQPQDTHLWYLPDTAVQLQLPPTATATATATAAAAAGASPSERRYELHRNTFSLIGTQRF